MNISNRFYVYALTDPSGYVFYIGKGSNGRVYKHFQKSRKNHNPHKWNKIQKILRENPDVQRKDLVRYIFTGLTEEKALDLEIQIIEEIGLDNLTNICPGGEQGPGYRGEEHAQCKISKEEVQWIKWLYENSKRGNKENFQKYGEHWSDNLTLGNYEIIASGMSWKHVSPKRPPFFEKRWDDLRYICLEEYLTTDLMMKEAAEKHGFKKHHLAGWLHYNLFSFGSRFEEEYGMTPKESLQRVNQRIRYKAVEEYLITDATQKQAAEKYGFKQHHLNNWLHQNQFSLITRFEEEHNTTTRYSPTQPGDQLNLFPTTGKA